MASEFGRIGVVAAVQFFWYLQYMPYVAVACFRQGFTDTVGWASCRCIKEWESSVGGVRVTSVG